jgi:hypothetical protein
VFNLESPGVGAPGRRPRHEERYHDLRPGKRAKQGYVYTGRGIPISPLVSFLSHALKMAETWPDIFTVDPKDLPGR